MTVRFEWDPVKARKNLQKHGIAFAGAVHVFDDPNALFFQDHHDESGELRWQALGVANGVAILLVVHTVTQHDGTETIRLISARPATKTERKRYEEENG